MPLLRLLMAGLVALMAMAAVFFTAVLVLFTGLVGWVAQLFRPKQVRPAAMRPSAGRRGPAAGGDVIDVEATPVAEKPDDRRLP